jgi:ABC-type transport system substrate-binding protein
VTPSPSTARQTADPTPTAATPIASRGPFRPAAYPSTGDAPCGQKAAPDASRAAYRGQLKRIVATDRSTVRFELCRPDASFLAKIAAPAFAINDSGWLAAHVDPAATEQPIVSQVNGTGPYRLERWDRGSEVSLARNDDYWGTPAHNERAIVRWRDAPSQRVVELQGGTVDGIDLLDAAGVATAGADVNLQLLPRPGLNTVYLGFDTSQAPFDDHRVRQAIALGIDRQRIVDRLFPHGSELATHYTPCALTGACGGTPWYDHDPIQGKELLASAGFVDGFDTTIHIRDSARSALPDPAGVAAELQNQLLTNLGIRARVIVEPDETFVADAEAGKLDGVHLTVQAAPYPDAGAMLDPQFGSEGLREFGPLPPALVQALADARATTDPGARRAAFARAEDLIRGHVPLIPLVHTGSTGAFRGDVEGAAVSPLRLERFAAMTPGDRRQLVWLTTGEPPGLYCADETDPIATLVCSQLTDGLYGYDPSGTSVVPALARSCSPDKDLTTWTCRLRDGVRFHDGSTLDANDVVDSFAAQWDAKHPLHAGRDGTFAPFASSLGGFLNPPASGS